MSAPAIAGVTYFGEAGTLTPPELLANYYQAMVSIEVYPMRAELNGDCTLFSRHEHGGQPDFYDVAARLETKRDGLIDLVAEAENLTAEDADRVSTALGDYFEAEIEWIAP